MVAVGEWLGGLEARLPLHAQVLRRLIDRAHGDERIRVVIVGCSIGRGAGDVWSDLDVNVSVATEAWERFTPDIEPMVRALDDAEPVLLLQHALEELGDRPHLRVLAEMASGAQLDLTVNPLSAWSRHGRAPDVVALYDPDGWTEPLIEEPAGWRATPAQVAEWHALAWAALSDCAKHLTRDSVWEALSRIEDARRMTWRLWAVTIGAPQPAYGVTAVYDTANPSPPPRIAESLAGADAPGIRRAALALADGLDDVAMRLHGLGTDPDTTDRFTLAVRRRLAPARPEQATPEDLQRLM
jgi:hypothetical protein